MAHRAGRKILKLDLGQVQSKFVGESEQRLSAAFAAVRQQRAILFVDEVDSLAAARTGGSNGYEQAQNGFRNHLINQLDEHPDAIFLWLEQLDSRVQTAGHNPLRPFSPRDMENAIKSALGRAARRDNVDIAIRRADLEAALDADLAAQRSDLDRAIHSALRVT